jgi:EAL domain-containing protein (putative c-di-GMP-specific phosphodiesterase class I)
MRAVLGLSESLNMTSTAEGIEQEAQADLLRILGCSEAQGYLFWRPMPATAFRGLLSEIPPLSNAANLDTALVA